MEIVRSSRGVHKLCFEGFIYTKKAAFEEINHFMKTIITLDFMYILYILCGFVYLYLH